MTTTNLFSNRATAKLAVALTSGDTAVTLVPGGGDWFPSPGANEYFRLVVQKGSGQSDQREYMTCTSREGDVLTVTRAQEGTPAANFDAGDEASLVVTAVSFGEFPQKQGMVLQGALEVEAAPTTPMGVANKDYVDATTIDDVPNDGKTYGRQFGLWDMLGDAAQLPIPIPIGAGGTGGISLSEAQLNLIIARTTIDDLPPTSPPPKYGDRWIKPSNMSEMVWVPNQGVGGVWVNPADAGSEAYPIPITKGGTGATTIKQALINLGIADHDSFKVSVNATDLYVTAKAKAAGGHAILSLEKTTTGTAGIYGQGGTVAAPLTRWFLQLGNGTPEAGLNAGSDFVITRFNDAGAAIDNPFSIDRKTGAVSIPGTLTTGPLRFPDGTVAAPSIAFASEPGLGWFRPGTSQISMAAQGQAIVSVGASSASTSIIVNPRAAGGQAIVNLGNIPYGSGSVFSTLAMTIDSAGTGYLSLSQQGGATKQNLYFGGAAGYSFDAAVVATSTMTVATLGTANLVLTVPASPTNSEANIIGQKNGQWRFRLQMVNGGVETGGNAGSDWTLQRFADNGSHLGTPIIVRRSDGYVTIESALGVGGAFAAASVSASNGGFNVLTLGDDRAWTFNQDASWKYQSFSPNWYWNWNRTTGDLHWSANGKVYNFLANGDFHAPLNVFAGNDTGFGLIQNGSYPYLRFTADNWRWQMDRATGALAYYNPSNVFIFGTDGGGNFTAAGQGTFSTRVTVSGTDQATFYAPQGGMRADGGGSCFFAPNGGISLHGGGGKGVVFSSYQVDGGWINVTAMAGNPSWGSVDYLLTHQSGAWAGSRVVTAGREIQFILSNATPGWGEIKAAAFTPQSDIRFKNDVRPLGATAHDIFMNIEPIRWTWPEPEPDGPPLYYDTLEDMGFSAQNLYAHLPLAVRGNPTAVDDDGDPISAAINPVPVLALTVHELQALIAHVSTLEARINQLETQ